MSLPALGDLVYALPRYEQEGVLVFAGGVSTVVELDPGCEVGLTIRVRCRPA